MAKKTKKIVKYYSKAKIDDRVFYFDTFEKFYTFVDLYFRANKNNECIEVALSNREEFELNTEE